MVWFPTPFPWGNWFMCNLIILLASHPVTVYKNSNLKNHHLHSVSEMFRIAFSSIISEYITGRFLAKKLKCTDSVFLISDALEALQSIIQ